MMHIWRLVIFIGIHLIEIGDTHNYIAVVSLTALHNAMQMRLYNHLIKSSLMHMTPYEEISFDMIIFLSMLARYIQHNCRTEL